MKPEASYFVADGGQRTAYIFCDMKEPSQIPALAEPWFLAFNAKVDIQPAMNAADLAKAAPAMEQAVRKYASRTMTA